MNSPKLPPHSGSRVPTTSERRTRSYGIIAVVFGLLLMLGIVLLRPRSPVASRPETEEGAVTEAPATAATTPTPSPIRPEFQKLVGKWLRPDGGYVLEIRSVEAGGNVQAAYFNPRPITVFRAEATYENATTKLVVELRDVGYPGCLYTLAYDPAGDQLTGNYYQAAIQQNFTVVFERN